MEVDIGPFVGGTKIDQIKEVQEKANKKHILINYSTNVEE